MTTTNCTLKIKILLKEIKVLNKGTDVLCVYGSEDLILLSVFPKLITISI